jgi:hypothetical protein
VHDMQCSALCPCFPKHLSAHISSSEMHMVMSPTRRAVLLYISKDITGPWLIISTQDEIKKHSGCVMSATTSSGSLQLKYLSRCSVLLRDSTACHLTPKKKQANMECMCQPQSAPAT